MSADLTIPDEAFELAVPILSGYMTESDAYDAGSDALRAAAPLIVAAELERIAKGRSMIAPEELLDRAAELRGERKPRRPASDVDDRDEQVSR